ncbi:MAG: YceI family protein [Nocardioidaceae bacterium]
MSELDTITPGTWVIDPTHTEIGFTVRHIMSRVRGKFEKFEGQIVSGDVVDNATATATVDLSSINTGTQQRDDHLRSSDFFNVDKTKTMTFTSTGLHPKGDGFVVTGDLAIGDVTRSVEWDVEFLGAGNDPWGGQRIGLEVTGKLSRRDFGIDFNIPLEGDKLMIGDTIHIQVNVEAVLQTDAAAGDAAATA